ncbi:uncharacterized protein METZ01_LOCUS251589 [marine metagenome]|uniref:Phosphomannomutase n=1 Tax=marine metagenome TaxID=408172 RepID=A0A382IH90_9ZZZZ
MDKVKYIFDVDGTLTPSRQKIDSEFLNFLLNFAKQNDVYLVTGSDRPKTIEQIGKELYFACQRVYNCSGSDVYEKDILIYRDEWTLPSDAEEFLIDELHHSKFPVRTGNHIERRPGGVNFSVLGRGSEVILEEREEYVKWDINTGERKNIAERFKKRFPEIGCQVGGQTGLDISPLGCDKSQILRDFKPIDLIYFFGDKLKEGENDYPLGHAIEQRRLGMVFEVTDYHHTWDLLK